jgi:hypothetical protein
MDYTGNIFMTYDTIITAVRKWVALAGADFNKHSKQAKIHSQWW